MVIAFATDSVLFSRRPVLAWLLFALLLTCSCSDPGTAPKEPLPEFPVMDSTTHDYSWTHVTVGPPVPTFVNYLYRVHAFSDTNVWMIGYIELDTSILSIPSQKPKSTANVVHWDGKHVRLLSYEAIVGESSRPSPTAFREILEVNGNIWLMTPHGYTEILPDTVRIVKFKEFRTLPYYSKMTKGRSGRVYWYNEEGDLAYLDPSNDEQLIHVETFSKDIVRDFTELEIDRYLIAREVRGGQDYLQEIANGESRVLRPTYINDSTLVYVGEMWSNREYFYHFSAYYLYIESIADSHIRTEIRIPNAEQRHGYLERAEGRSSNDVFWVGHLSTVFHYNGNSIDRGMGLADKYSDFILTDLSLTENSLFLVGAKGNLGITAFLIGTKR